MTARVALALSVFLLAGPAEGADLYTPSSWSSLVSDRSARKIGDVLTVLVYENATATGTADNGSNKGFSVQGQVAATHATGTYLNDAGNLGLSSSSDNNGTTTRSGSMLAEISVVVDRLLPNGDLHVAGSQTLTINGEKTRIGVSGNVRLADISPTNVILSTSLANATINYDGKGFVSASSAPGIVTRVLNWLDLP